MLIKCGMSFDIFPGNYAADYKHTQSQLPIIMIKINALIYEIIVVKI